MKQQRRRYYLLLFGGLLVLVALGITWRTHRRTLFQKTATGLQYQIVDRGEGPSPQLGDMLLLHMRYTTDGGVVLSDTTDQELPMAFPYSQDTLQKDGGILEAVGMLQKKGDRLYCKLNGEILEYVTARHGLKQNEEIFLSLQLQDIMPEESYKQWETEKIAMLQKEYKEKIDQQHQKDIQAITHHLKENNTVAQATASGLYYVIDTPGRGREPKQGDRVEVRYTGRFLDGKVFDTSVADVAKQHGIHNPQRAYEAIAFQVGLGQVIRGWDIGIMHLRQGDKGRLFVPSTLAYGDRGVGDGWIPPNAILVFDVELVDVQDE